MKRLLFLLAVVAQSDTLPRENAVIPVAVAELAGYAEGLAFDADGFVYASLLHGGQIVRFRIGSTPQAWSRLQEPNGHRILPNGTHLVAAKGAVLWLESDGRVRDTLASHFGTERLKNPNDLALDGDGGVYFTDPGPDDDPIGKAGRIYYARPGHELKLVATGFCAPNGLLVRADGRVLYVDDSCNNRITAFDIDGPGHVTQRRLFATLPDSGRGQIDGIATDDHGRLYVADYGVGRVEVVDTAGHLLRRYSTGLRLTSNLAFGGPKMDQLFVTGAPDDEKGSGRITRLSLVGVRGRDHRTLPARRW